MQWKPRKYQFNARLFYGNKVGIDLTQHPFMYRVPDSPSIPMSEATNAVTAYCNFIFCK